MTSNTLPTADLQDITVVATLRGDDEVNTYLGLGWVLLAVSSSQYSEHGYAVSFHLGWRRSLGEPQQPKTEHNLPF